MQRTFLGLAASFLLVVACTPASQSSATGTTATATQPAASQTAGTPIRVRDFTLEPLSLSLTGSTIALAVTNDGPTVHNVTIRDASGKVLVGTRDLREDEMETISTEIGPGTYDLICTLPGHESLGIKGTLTVETP